MNKKEERKQSNLKQLQIALDNGWVKFNRIKDIIQFRMKDKPKIDFMLSDSSYFDIADNRVYRSSMKQFLKWYRRRRIQ